MPRSNLTVLGVTLAFVACGAASATGGPPDDGGGRDSGLNDGTADGLAGDDSSTDGAPVAETGSADTGAATDAGTGTDASAADGSFDSSGADVCESGPYDGRLAGLYTSHLTGVGLPIPFDGNVALTVGPRGTAGTTCTVDGVDEDCSNVLPLRDGNVTGVADAQASGDASVGGFPFFCTVTGKLDCQARKLVDGWIQCTYCIGPLADGGLSCALLSGVGGTTGVGGHFAGPMTAAYDASAHAFVMGAWNGAEALAGNDGGSPGPDGGPLSSYLSDSGYLGPGQFGGSGTWTANAP